MAFETVLGLAGLLALAVVMLPVARRVNFPYTVLLAAVGVLLGVVAGLMGESRGAGIASDFIHSVQSFGITSDTVLFLFLPALVFESALAIDARKLIEDLAPILLLAVVGLLISTFVVGYSVSAVSGYAIIPCLLLGAIVSATDPVAVVAIFKDLGAPKRLAILVEGESLFNDATAIVLFTILAAVLAQGNEVSLLGGTGSFVKVFIGGILVGYLLARAVCAAIARLVDVPLVETTLTISLAYLAFVVAEHYLHVSGVMAVVTAALVMGSYGRTAISASTWHTLTETWEFIGFWANSLIFVLVGVKVPELLSEAGLREMGWLLVLLVAAFAARALIIYGLLPLMSAARMAQRVSTAYRTVMFWGGLRGAVSLALALAVLENPRFPEEIQAFIGILVTGFVLFTLFVNAPTMSVLMRFLGLDKLSPTDIAVRNRVMTLSLANIREKVAQVSSDQRVEKDLSDEILGHYNARIQAAKASMGSLEDLPERDWLLVGLTTLINRERKLCLQHFADGFISPNITRQHLAVTDHLLDSLKAGGLDGYRAAVERQLGFPLRFRVSLFVQRRFGAARPLSRQLADRFELLLAAQSLLREQTGEDGEKLSEIYGERVIGQLQALLDDRLQRTEQALEALRLQYPDYARSLQERYLGRMALRLEEADYRSMFDESVISQEVYTTFTSDLLGRRRALDERPKLDLGLEPEKLVAQVPFFNRLGTERIAEIAKLLKPRLVLPGELVVRKGDVGDAMYFISSGTVRVDLQPQPVTLGSGSFFGEIALLRQGPRGADVKAFSYCQILALFVKDFDRLLGDNPELRGTIEEVAAERLGETGN
jgi:CPA1 family monovalent cation:H+ antiporter